MRQYNILLADDHAVLRSGLKLLLSLEPQYLVVGECSSHSELLSFPLLRENQIDLVTLDLDMPLGTGQQTIRLIVGKYPRTKVVVLTMHDDPSYARMAIQAGASAFIVKSAADSELLSAMQTVLRGGVFSSLPLVFNGGSIEADPTSELQATSATSPIELLSDREKQVLGQLAYGYTNQQIADQFEISIKSVESYRARLMSKLRLKDRVDLVKFAIANGLLQRD